MRFRPNPQQVVRLLRQRPVQLVPAEPAVDHGALREPTPEPRSTEATSGATRPRAVPPHLDGCGVCDVPSLVHGIRYATEFGRHVWVPPHESQVSQRRRAAQHTTSDTDRIQRT